MSDEWVETTLGEVLTLEYGKALPEKNRDGAGYPVLGSNGIVGLHSKALVEGPGIVVGRKGTAGSVTWVDTSFSPIDTTYWVRLRDAGLTLEFAYLLLLAANLPGVCAQTGVPGLNRDRAYEVPISLPPLPVQRRIVDLMAHLDNHLANLQVEEEALTKVRSAALHDAMSGGLAQFPQNDEWEDLTLGESADFINGFAFKPTHLEGTALPVIRIRQLLDPSAEVDYTDIEVPQRNLIRDGDLIFSWSGTLASRFWRRGPAALNQHLFKVLARTGSDLGWLHLALDHSVNELMMKTHGTTMKHVTKKTLESHNVRRPPLAVQRRVVDLMANLDNHLANLRAEREAAEQTRLAMVVLLLSGARVVPHSYDSLLSEVA